MDIQRRDWAAAVRYYNGQGRPHRLDQPATIYAVFLAALLACTLLAVVVEFS